MIKPTPVSETVAAGYQLFIDRVNARRGFWSEAGKPASAAGRYRHALSVADRTWRHHGLDQMTALAIGRNLFIHGQRRAVVTKLVEK
ncbi:hypothetical protein [Paraburkholderia sp. EG304]|uniref:hypothetical protein n=1 Tax=Paraburkholderia sp. EG304 TaxID=3237015 RepID=UPI00397E67FC